MTLIFSILRFIHIFLGQRFLEIWTARVHVLQECTVLPKLSFSCNPIYTLLHLIRISKFCMSFGFFFVGWHVDRLHHLLTVLLDIYHLPLGCYMAYYRCKVSILSNRTAFFFLISLHPLNSLVMTLSAALTPGSGLLISTTSSTSLLFDLIIKLIFLVFYFHLF